MRSVATYEQPATGHGVGTKGRRFGCGIVRASDSELAVFAQAAVSLLWNRNVAHMRDLLHSDTCFLPPLLTDILAEE